MAEVHIFIDYLARVLELVGVGIIVSGVVFSTLLFVRQGSVRHDWKLAYDRYRANLGRGILLGLELLVGADIMSTVTAPLTFVSVGLLGAIIVIRTFLSFSLETEIEGCWPWERSEKSQHDEAER